jgi:hypothetical protein
VWGAKASDDAPGSLISERLRCKFIVGNHAHAFVAEDERHERCHSMWLMRAACWCAVFLFALNAADAMARSYRNDPEAGGAKLAFLSGADKQTQQPATETPLPTPPDDSRNFDGSWTFTSGGCTYTGSLPARIVGGKIIVRGGSGQVDADGTLHSVGAGNGMTLTAVGQLSGNTGSGTFSRSDGCVGSWIAIKHETPRGRRP